MLRSLVVALALLTACNFMSSGVAGSGVAASEQRAVGAFERLASDGSFAVEVEVGPAASVRVEADDNIVPLITTEVAGDTLKISSRGSFNTARPIKVYVATPRLAGLEHDGSGSVRVRGISGARFAAALSGSGSVQLAGRSDSLTVSLDGSGSLAAAELIAASVTVALSGSGDVQVHASERLVASVDGSGSVGHAGGAKGIDRNISGSGGVTPL